MPFLGVSVTLWLKIPLSLEFPRQLSAGGRYIFPIWVEGVFSSSLVLDENALLQR